MEEPTIKSIAKYLEKRKFKLITVNEDFLNSCSCQVAFAIVAAYHKKTKTIGFGITFDYGSFPDKVIDMMELLEKKFGKYTFEVLPPMYTCMKNGEIYFGKEAQQKYREDLGREKKGE